MTSRMKLSDPPLAASGVFFHQWSMMESVMCAVQNLHENLNSEARGHPGWGLHPGTRDWSTLHSGPLQTWFPAGLHLAGSDLCAFLSDILQELLLNYHCKHMGNVWQSLLSHHSELQNLRDVMGT